MGSFIILFIAILVFAALVSLLKPTMRQNVARIVSVFIFFACIAACAAITYGTFALAFTGEKNCVFFAVCGVLCAAMTIGSILSFKRLF